jgi:tetratricopeptide (TPR) repeat protein
MERNLRVLLTHKFIVSVFCLLLISPVAFGGQSEDAILNGNALIQKKDYDGAIKEYENALKANPKNSKAHLLLGLTYANKGDLDKAIKFSKYALTLEKSYAAYHNLGLIYADKGNYQDAIDAYQGALEENPKSAMDWLQLGRVYAAEGNFEKAIDAYKKSIELNSRMDDAYLGLGAAYYWNGDKPSALEQGKKLRQLKINQKADALFSWIKNNETKKKAVSSAVPAPSPSASSNK